MPRIVPDVLIRHDPAADGALPVVFDSPHSGNVYPPDFDFVAPLDVIRRAEDAFVDRRFSEETADLIPGMRRWLTDEYHHNGLRTDGAHVLDRLIGLARGTL